MAPWTCRLENLRGCQIKSRIIVTSARFQCSTSARCLCELLACSNQPVRTNHRWRHLFAGRHNVGLSGKCGFVFEIGFTFGNRLIQRRFTSAAARLKPKRLACPPTLIPRNLYALCKFKIPRFISVTISRIFLLLLNHLASDRDPRERRCASRVAARSWPK
jgi:hypothetical protein